VDEEHVDPVRAKPFEARVHLGEDVGAARVAERAGLTGGRDLYPALGDEDDVATALLEGARHHFLGVACPVGGRGVDAVHPAIEGAMNRLDGFVVLDRPVAVTRHGPAAEANRGHLQSGTAERTVAHDRPSL
jgi:hypothetical protein